MNLKHEFKDDVSSGAFKKVDGEMRIMGKLAQVSLIHNIYDIWIISPDLKPIPERKLSFMLSKFPQNMKYTRLCGEAWIQTKDKFLILKVMNVLKIRKRKTLSLRASCQLTERMT